ncbi:MAG TPA: branched-chain amino acid ABC transporter permease [Eoetvoesiella sp.]|uniref:branched-chain amino acid ABC transporter permease n=1 Tax=Eoetvoesiella sp. TaxID=1966355 RepID=UPI002C0C2B4C|nr:branched-chain amino acid ABC transporter permease [Eoetvoesiella sp.]HWK60330.1 branched-chain amino acid ABC transporter permease [Eoetvoesiella sp.]
MLGLIIPLLVDSLTSAALIFFVAVGLTLVFSVLRVLNVAHGSFYSIGAYVAASLCLWVISAGLSPWLTFVALLASAVILAALLGPLVQSTLIQWTLGKSEAVQILATFGLFLILEDLQRIVFGVSSIAEDTPMTLLGVTSIGSVTYLNYQILLIIAAIIVVFGLRMMLVKTRIGKLLSAVVFDREMALSVGINTKRLFTFAFTLGVFLAALGGALAVPTSGAAPGLGAETIVLAFAVAAIGGLGQIEGAALAAVIVGLARVVAIYFAPQLEAVAPYIVMLVVLLIRPYGLFGNDQARRI